MIKKEEDKIEYALKKVSILLSPDRAGFDLVIQKIINKKEIIKQGPIKSPYSYPVWFLQKRFILFKIAPATIAIALAIIVGMPEISGNSKNSLANEIIKDIEDDSLSLSIPNEEDELFEEIENSTFDELAKISFYEE